MPATPYIGRFAPSPTGPLHLGSLTSALCSYLQAKKQGGQWLVRIEDIDTPRVDKQSIDIQLKQLEAFGFKWDQSILYQSQRMEAYLENIEYLKQQGNTYYCECTRKQLKQYSHSSEVGIIYPRLCREKNLIQNKRYSTRFKSSDSGIHFEDAVYGSQNFNIQNLTSDWVLQRADGIVAYHLAVVLDDYYQGITQVVRGFDILPLTALQIDLQNKLDLPQPSYLHHPLLIHNNQKLSKQNLSPSISEFNKTWALNTALQALGQEPIYDFNQLDEFWLKATKNWQPDKIPPNNYSI